MVSHIKNAIDTLNIHIQLPCAAKNTASIRFTIHAVSDIQPLIDNDCR